MQDAAFANGVIGHGLVRDDMHVGSVSHLGTVLVPTLLALAESARASGRDFLTALVAGYEVGGKVGRMVIDVEVTKIFRPTGVTGPIAAAAAGAKLLDANADQTVTALALGANAAAGYNEWAATGGSEMLFHTGLAARSGVTAVQLALEGAYVSRTAIDGEAGLLAAFHRDLAPPIPELFADRPEILSVFFKPVPACNFAQSAAQAALVIAQRKKLRANDVERVVVRVTKAAALYPGCDVSGPFEHVLQAKMSIHYNVAAALRYGNFDERNYVPQQNADVLRSRPARGSSSTTSSRKRSPRSKAPRSSSTRVRATSFASASRTSCRPTTPACARASPPRQPACSALRPPRISASSSMGSISWSTPRTSAARRGSAPRVRPRVRRRKPSARGARRDDARGRNEFRAAGRGRNDAESA